jgi:hypothetical protein
VYQCTQCLLSARSAARGCLPDIALYIPPLYSLYIPYIPAIYLLYNPYIPLYTPI